MYVCVYRGSCYYPSMRALAVEVESSMTPIHHPATSASDENVYNYHFLFDTSAACSRGMSEVSGNETRVSLPGQTLRARLTGDEREREGGSADSEQDSVIQWNVYYVMTTLNLNCACDPCVTSYYRISTESHDCCNLIGSANIPAEPTETCSESADPLSLSLSSPLARPLVFRSSPVKRARRVCPGRLD